ncbi:replication restart helicase PriA [Candidatus Nesciobacter abundans]|uniref:Replication restart protein PriA n=1 Tax=Candidatus Nesciobacter abundans TaxID=2601668 RepID=A0A5C0UH20_9PROT|nr:primosomal protein N' [Candidatus Nesciobacter abundans]QEK38843.1 primosomal protein N' [Candidatus Nesciobacter abundans]
MTNKIDIIKSMNTVDVLLTYSWSADNLYTYKTEGNIEPGTLVKVEAGSKESIGVVWNSPSRNTQTSLKNIEIKNIKTVLPYKITESSMEWIDLVSNYTLISKSLVLKMVLGSFSEKPGYFCSSHDLENINEILNTQTSKTSSQNSNKATIDIETNMENINPKQTYKFTISDTELNLIKIKKLLKENHISSIKFPILQKKQNPFEFSEDQKSCVAELSKLNGFNPVLLEGQTGSGKTDVYFELVKKVLKQNKQVLIILPEIALAKQIKQRFINSFGYSPYVWHNKSKDSVWKWACEEEYGVLIGVRSAIWIPFKNLGLIIVDEEHSNTYKQENGPRYNAKDLAILKAKKENCPIVLVSATPSLETVWNVQNKIYKHIKLTRQIKHELDIEIVKTKTWMSQKLKTNIEKTLEKKEQVMLFLNKRGFAPFVICEYCNYRLLCSECSTGVVCHKNFYTHCTYCAKKEKLQKICPSCKEEANWKMYGIAIQKIHQEMQNMFPDKNIQMLSSDESNEVDVAIKNILSGKIDIIIGTQILAQGCHFPNLTLVGIVQGDVGMHTGDIRHTERMYQTITQVKGRCGRADKKGKVIIQTQDDESILLKSIAENKTDIWVKEEMEMRQNHDLPPFSRMIRIVFGSSSEASIEKFVHSIKKPKISAEILGPAPTQLTKYKNQYRWSFLIKYKKGQFVQKQVKLWIDSIKSKLPRNIQIIIDVDPQSFY